MHDNRITQMIMCAWFGFVASMGVLNIWAGGAVLGDESVTRWNTTRVVDLLRRLGPEFHAGASPCIANGVDGKSLLRLSAQDDLNLTRPWAGVLEAQLAWTRLLPKLIRVFVYYDGAERSPHTHTRV